MHLLVGDSLNISRSTAGRCIRAVSLEISKLSGRFIKFPVGGDAVRAKEAFSSIAGFPNVVGCIDGTFIRTQRPTANEGDFVNRKGYQMCCDANFYITRCNDSWPGSVHDSRIFRTSALCRQFENDFLVAHSHYTDPCHFLNTFKNRGTCPPQLTANGLPCTYPFSPKVLHLPPSTFTVTNITDAWKLALEDSEFRVKITMNDKHTNQTRGCVETYLTIDV